MLQARTTISYTGTNACDPYAKGVGLFKNYRSYPKVRGGIYSNYIFSGDDIARYNIINRQYKSYNNIQLGYTNQYS